MKYKNRSDLISSVLYLADMPAGGYVERLYYCKADIIKPDFSDFLILKSYSTVVAAFQHSTGVLWVFNYYSSTTCLHIDRFTRWLRFEFYPVSVKRINLYNDSKTSKRVAQMNIDDDFASVIAAATAK